MAITDQDLIDRNIDNQRPLGVSDEELKKSEIRRQPPTVSSIVWSIRGLLQSQLCCISSIDKQTFGQFDELKRLLKLLESNGCCIMSKNDWNDFDNHYDIVKEESTKSNKDEGYINVIQFYAKDLLERFNRTITT